MAKLTRRVWRLKHKRPIVPPISSMCERPAKLFTLPARQEADNRRSWLWTEQGQTSVQGKNPNPHGSSQGIPNRRVGPSDERLLGLLVHPMRGDELARQLNLSRQRIHQLVVKLLALGRIRVGDPDRVTFIIARQDDSSLLLSSSEERVLSSLSQTDVTPASYVATDLRMPLRRVLDRLSRLV